MKNRSVLAFFFTFLVSTYSPAQFGFRYTSTELKELIRKKKLDQLLIPIMEEYGIDTWITLTRDLCDDMTNVIWERDAQIDPIAEYIGGENVTVPAAFIFTTSDTE